MRAVEKTRQVTRAMEAVSAVKMRKSQERALSARVYAYTAIRLLSRVSAGLEVGQNPLARGGAGEKLLLVVLSSERGLAGSFNSALFREVSRFLEKEGYAKNRLEVLALGRKAEEYYGRRAYKVEPADSKLSERVTPAEVHILVREIINLYQGGEFRRVVLAYTNFHSTVSQEPVIRNLLPLEKKALLEVVRGIVPEKGKYKDFFKLHELEGTDMGKYTFEPGAEEVLEGLLPTLLSVFLYHAALETRASEFSARMVAMRNAQDKAKEVLHGLTLYYNQARQAGITREVSEIIGGMEALKN